MNSTIKFRRIVIKLGSSTLTHPGGKLNLNRIEHLLRQLIDLKNQGRELLLVTSGAIGAGVGELRLKEKPDSIPEQQAAAAIGQGLLLSIYNKLLHEYGEKGAQVLLTASDLEDRQRFLNAFNTLETLLKYEVIPIINENDTVATQEIKFGDNDTLSARVAGLVEADLLIILSDIEGLYDGNPEDSKQSQLNLIRRVKKITPELEDMAGGEGSQFATGGMYTKVQAAKIAVNSGITMIIGPGYRSDVLLDIVTMLEEETNYNLGTTFLPAKDCLNKKKQWLQFNLPASGDVIIDQGAARALLQGGKSLLPGGITDIKGTFNPGDPVNIIREDGSHIGKGLVNYSAQEVNIIKGEHSQKIKELLGYFNQAEVIHRDNMVIRGG